MTVAVAKTWLTVAEAAEESRYCKKTVLRALASRQLKGSKPSGGRRWRINRRDFERWMQTNPR